MRLGQSQSEYTTHYYRDDLASFTGYYEVAQETGSNLTPIAKQ